MQKTMYAVVVHKIIGRETIFLIMLVTTNMMRIGSSYKYFSARTNEGIKHTTWGVWSQGGNPNH